MRWWGGSTVWAACVWLVGAYGRGVACNCVNTPKVARLADEFVFVKIESIPPFTPSSVLMNSVRTHRNVFADSN